MTRDTESVFAQGALVVPDFATPAEEARILQRIGEAPWLTELSRRVQHYGYRYDYRGARRPVPAAPFPRWAEVMAERLRVHFGGVLPVQCIVNEYRPGQGIGMHADHADFGPVVASLSLADDCLRVRRRMSRTAFPAGSLARMDFCLISVPFGHCDEPEILPYENASACPIGSDVGHQ